MHFRAVAVHPLLLIAALAVAGGLAVACGSDDSSTFPANSGDGGAGGGDDSSLDPGEGGAFGDGGLVNPANVDSIAFNPPSATVTVDGTGPQSANFTLHAKFKDGSSGVVTPQSFTFDRPDLAKASGSNPIAVAASGSYAGTGHLQAVYGGKAATADFTVNVKLREVGPGVLPAAVTALGLPSLVQDPSVSALLYPYDKTLFPLGLASPLLMWNAPQANDVYRVAYDEQGYSYEGYFVVGATGQLRVPQDAWDHLTASNRGDPIHVSLSRYDAVAGTPYASAAEDWPLAPASLRGAIYYWTTSSGGHLSRIRPGTGTAPEILNNGACMGCHGVSADGTTLVAAVEGGTNMVTEPGGSTKNDPTLHRRWVSFDLPAATVRDDSTRFAGNVAVNPDGKYVVFGSQTLRLGDTHTGQEITGTGLDTVPLDTGMSGLMTPAFSPDGTKLVAVEGAGNWYHNLINGKLLLLDFNATTQKFTNPRGLATAASFPANERAISYPTFTPDGNWVAFHVGDYATGCDAQGCDDAATQAASLWLQNTNGAAPVRLATLTDPAVNSTDDNHSFEPTFNPVERGGYFWVVFTSSRDWGNKVTGTPNNGKKRLWVAAIDKSGAADPSHPPFFLEGQEEATTNMRGFWALAACTPTAGGGACGAGFECCSGFCDQNVCVDVSQVACKPVGDTCQTVSDCCNPSAVVCTSGHCTVKVN